jgi:hypothetical protein
MVGGVGGQVGADTGERGVEGGGQLVGPGPGLGDLDLLFPSAADDPGGGVEQALIIH